MLSQFTNLNLNIINNKYFVKNDIFINKIKLIRSEIIKNNDTEYIIKENCNFDYIINKLSKSYWVSNKLKYDNLNYNVNIIWKNNNITNNIYIKTTRTKFKYIKLRLHFFLKIINYIQNNNTTSINIYIVLSDLKKYINTDEIISPHHINTGYTDLNKKNIFIWREEEFEKVTFHELIHLFLKDHKDENILLNTKIKGPTSFFEAITDFKAIIYNIIYISIITNIKISKLIEYEYNFIYNQAKYVYFNLKIHNKQNTPAYSYFILKHFIFKYFINNFSDDIFNNIFYNNIKYNLLINLIKNYELDDYKFINFNSARMTLFELI